MWGKNDSGGRRMKIINTHTGKIFVDIERMLEFLTVGDYGKENNIKADFLGLHTVSYTHLTLPTKLEV